MLSRRGLITGLTSLIVAPAIVRVSHLMPISVPKFEFQPYKLDDPLPAGIYDIRFMQVVMKDGKIITDMQLAEDTRKYIRSIMRVT